MKKKSNRHTME